MERDPRPDREMDSRSERAHASDGTSERFADVYGAERESARHAEERLEFLSGMSGLKACSKACHIGGLR